MRPVDAVRLSHKNEAQLWGQSVASCYHCLSIFGAARIEDLAEEDDGLMTAICPECGVDAVIPGIVSKDDLKAANEMWFGRKSE